MALHKIKLHHTDGTAATFYENPDGTWDYCLHNGDVPNWFNSISTQMMIASVCAASDLGATVSIEKGGVIDMAEYIDKTELRKAMYKESFEKDSDLQKWDSGCWIRYKLFENVLASIPVADFVPVVRCKDCKHRDPEDYKCDSGQLERACCLFPVNDDYFCAYGERK